MTVRIPQDLQQLQWHLMLALQNQPSRCPCGAKKEQTLRHHRARTIVVNSRSDRILVMTPSQMFLAAKCNSVRVLVYDVIKTVRIVCLYSLKAFNCSWCAAGRPTIFCRENTPHQRRHLYCLCTPRNLALLNLPAQRISRYIYSALLSQPPTAVPGRQGGI